MDGSRRKTCNRLSNALAIAQALGSALACAVLLVSGVHAGPAISCKPILSILEIRAIRTSEILPYLWKATVFADNRHCATRSGMFEIDFIRSKEFGPDVQMTEKFRWKAGRFEVSVEFWADEAVFDYRIGFVAPCVCRDMPFH
jgi:hypothetical protein